MFKFYKLETASEFGGENTSTEGQVVFAEALPGFAAGQEFDLDISGYSEAAASERGWSGTLKTADATVHVDHFVSGDTASFRDFDEWISDLHERLSKQCEALGGNPECWRACVTGTDTQERVLWLISENRVLLGQISG